MLDFSKSNEKLVFGLDIGTRSIVGSVGYMERNKFNVVAHYSKEHETRAMMDGQIHDIEKVSETIGKVKRELEMQCGANLTETCIAAAGRVLRTIEVHIDYELPNEQKITSEHVYSLDLMGVEKAYDIIRDEDSDIKFYCVGYTVVRYYLNDYVISNLEGHKARKISADVLATFLPEDVVDGLYAAVEGADLTVSNLTLEPIAAINIAIPQNYRLLNIALVDVGAGTSDISITKDGSITAYGMIPHAGDELTECLVSKYLVEFNVAEKIKRASLANKAISFKDIMGLKQKITPEEVRDTYKPVVQQMTHEIAEKIKELNGGKSVSAVFVVGGGGKVVGFTECLAEYLDLAKDRVALRGAEVLMDVNFVNGGVKKDPLLVTPIGICMSFYEQKNNFVFVNINDERVKLYDNDKLTVLDAAIQVGFQNEDLFPKRGKELEFTVNGTKRMQRGHVGEPAVIMINGEPANINSKIVKNDRIVIQESTMGEPAAMTIERLPEYKNSMSFIVKRQTITCPCFVQVNGTLQFGDYQIQSGDVIEVLNYYTVEQLLQFLDIDYDSMKILVNNQVALPGDYVYENFTLEFEPFPKNKEELDDSEELADQNMNDMNDMSEYGDDSGTADNTMFQNTQDVQMLNGSEPAGVSEEPVQEKIVNVPHNIHVTVNGIAVTLRSKVSYCFVDVIGPYPFDTSAVGGSMLVKRVNGVECDFTTPISDKDAIDLYWEK